MAYKIIWLPKAEIRYADIIDWLQKHWSEKEIISFMSRTEDVLNLLTTDPEIYKESEKKGIRQAIITKHNLLLYRKKGNKIELLTFFNTQQKPSKKFK